MRPAFPPLAPPEPARATTRVLPRPKPSTLPWFALGLVLFFAILLRLY